MLRFLCRPLLLSFILWVTLLLCRPSAFVWASDVSSLTQSLAHYTAGLMLDWYGLNEEAIAEYQKAAASDENSYIIHLRLGANYIRTKAYKKAIKELQFASRINPQELQPHYLLALIYSAQEDFLKTADEYEIILKNFSEDDPANVDIHNYLGQLYYSQKEYQKAINQFKHILDLEPKNAEMMSILGSLYLEMDDRANAVKYFKQAIDVDPDHDGSLNSLGYLYAEQGIDLDEALDLVRRALDVSPDNGAYLDSLGWVYYKKGMYKKALEYLQKAVSLFEDPVIYEHLGDVYYKLQDIHKAVENWNRSLDLLPDQKSIKRKLKILKTLD